MRAVNPKINARRGVLRGGGAVGTSTVGSAVIGCDVAGVKTPLPGAVAALLIAPCGMGVACLAGPAGVGAGYGCEGGIGVLWDA